MTKRKLRKELSELARKSEVVATLYSGSLGIYIGGTQYVDVPNRPGFVYVRLRNNISELIQAHNEVVSPVYGLPVLLIRNKTYYEIYGRDTVQYGSYWDSNSSYLPKHGHQHEFDPDNNGGGDLVFVHGEQFYPMMTFPSGSDGSNTVLIAPYRYFFNGIWHYTGNTGVGDLLQYGPTGANNSKLLLVGTTSATGNPFVKLGSEFSEGITGAAALTQFVPTNITPIDEIPGAIIRLVTGTQTITWANIYDARQYMGILQAGSGTSGGATDFLGLSDTPNSYASQANKLVTVKADESGLEFRTNTGSFSGGSSTGTYFDGIQESFYPTRTVSDFTGSYYQFNTTPDNGTQLNTAALGVGNNQLAFAWMTNSSYDLKKWLLRGQYSLIINLFRETGSHSMTTYCKLYLVNGTVEELVAASDLAQTYDNTTAIPETFPLDFLFRFSLSPSAFTDNGPIRWLQSGARLLLRLYVNVSSGGSDGYLACTPDLSDIFNVNLQRQVLDNHYLTGTSISGGTTPGLGFYGQDEAVGLGTGTTLNVVGNDISLSISGTVLTLLHSDPTGTPHSFLDLTDTPDTYSGQGSKYVAVNSGGTALEFVTAPAGGGGGSGLVIYDDSVYKVTGTAISFDSNLSVAVTGTVAFVSASGGSGLSSSNLTLTTSGTTTATVNTRYYVDIGGLVGDRYFVLPAGTIGDQIELYLVTGSATYELIIKGDTGISINGGATATEWSRVFINQETLKFVANSITNWEVGYDGRIPCVGRLERITTPYVTGTADVWTLPVWNNIGVNVGNVADLTNNRFNCRRAGYYLPSGNYAPGAAITADNYCAASIWQNTTQVSTALNRPSVTSSLATVPLPTIPFYANLNDYFEYRFATQQANKGMGRTDDATTAPTKVGWVYFAIKELLRGP